jgi:carbon monoxide dehydrogenase subunit G
MKVTGNAVLHAAPAEVYAALNDPGVLARTIPGCRSLTPTGENRYAVTLTAGVASVKGTYEGWVELADQRPPHNFSLRASGSGTPGTVETTVRVALTEADGATRLDYDADAVVGGMVGGVGQRMLAGAARRTATQFFTAVDAELRGAAAGAGPAVPAPAVPAPAMPAPAMPAPAMPAPATPGPTTSGPATAPPAGGAVPSRTPSWAPREDDRVPFYVVLAGVGAGAFWALAGVLVGWRIARAGAGRRRR